MKENPHYPIIENAMETLTQLCNAKVLELYGESPLQFINDRLGLELQSIFKNKVAATENG